MPATFKTPLQPLPPRPSLLAQTLSYAAAAGGSASVAPPRLQPLLLQLLWSPICVATD